MRKEKSWIRLISPRTSRKLCLYALKNLKERGLEQVLLFVTDGLPGIREELLKIFPKVKHQTCWRHLARNVLKYVRAKDKLQVMKDFKRIHEQKTVDAAMTELIQFCEKFGIQPRKRRTHT